MKSTTAIFSGQEIKYDFQSFEGGNLTALFGGIDCDLKNAILGEELYINVFVAFGGVDIFLPDDVDVEISSHCLFGGVSDKREKISTPFKTRVHINVNCAFGGVDIK